jgi:hypothetical protein
MNSAVRVFVAFGRAGEMAFVQLLFSAKAIWPWHVRQRIAYTRLSMLNAVRKALFLGS